MTATITRLIAIAAGLTLGSPLIAQPAKEHKPCSAEVRLADGSLVRVVLLQESIDVQTAYGRLTVPVAEIRRIEFGLHLSAEAEKHVAGAIARLGSDVHKDREAAMRDLAQLGYIAAPAVRRAAGSTDKEVATRATAVLKQMGASVPAELLRLRETDVVHAEFTITGRVISPLLAASSSTFGKLALKLEDLRTLHVRQGGPRELTIDGEKHDQWLDTGLQVDPSLQLSVTAEGQVDLWPAGPGQYLSSPKGFNCAGKVGTFMAGALLGKVGGGLPFLVGERYEGTPAGEGRLWLYINPSPWGAAPSGVYRVRLTAENAALGASRHEPPAR